MSTTTRGTVLHLIDTTGPGGAETVYLQVAAGLRERGWDARMVVVGPGWVLDSIERLQLPVDVVETQGRADLKYLLGLRGLVQRHGISLIHAHLYSPAVYASAIGMSTGVPVVASFHGASDTVAGGLSRRLRYRLIGRQAMVACVSEALRDDLLRAHLLPAERVRVVHNGVDVASFAAADGSAVRREHGIGDDVMLVGAVGNIRPAKDYPNFLRAAAQLAGDTRLVFAIAGQCTDPLYSELLALRDMLGLGERVQFWGFRDDVAAVISAFDVLAIGSSTEGFSLAAVQAMAAGTPVVATRSGGPETIITPERDGLLVAKRSPDELAAGIRRLLDDAALRARVVEAARDTAQRRFSLQAMLDGYESIYGTMSDGSPLGRPGTEPQLTLAG